MSRSHMADFVGEHTSNFRFVLRQGRKPRYVNVAARQCEGVRSMMFNTVTAIALRWLERR